MGKKGGGGLGAAGAFYCSLQLFFFFLFMLRCQNIPYYRVSNIQNNVKC